MLIVQSNINLQNQLTWRRMKFLLQYIFIIIQIGMFIRHYYLKINNRLHSTHYCSVYPMFTFYLQSWVQQEKKRKNIPRHKQHWNRPVQYSDIHFHYIRSMKAILNGVMLIVGISALSTLGDELCLKQSFGHDSFVCVCDRY